MNFFHFEANHMDALHCNIVFQFYLPMVTVSRQITIIQLHGFVSVHAVTTLHEIHLILFHMEKINLIFQKIRF